MSGKESSTWSIQRKLFFGSYSIPQVFKIKGLVIVVVKCICDARMSFEHVNNEKSKIIKNLNLLYEILEDYICKNYCTFWVFVL